MTKILFSAILFFTLAGIGSPAHAQSNDAAGMCDPNSDGSFTCYVSSGSGGLPSGCSEIGGSLAGGFTCPSIPGGYEQNNDSLPDSQKNFTCTLAFGVGNWDCNTVFSKTPTGCTVANGSVTVCQNLDSLLPFTYCRGGTEYNAAACGPKQKAEDDAIMQNLNAHATPGKATCEVDSTYPGGSKVVCTPATITGCVASRYGNYAICNNYPPTCGTSATSDPGLALPGESTVTCDIPVDPSANQSQNTQQATQNNQLGYVPLEPLPGLQNVTNIDFPQFLGAIFKLLITAGALFAVILLVIGGIGYIISGSGVEIGEAKRRIWAALYGFIILVGAWLLLYTINPTLLNFNLSSIGGAPSSGPTGSGTPNAAVGNAAQQQQEINTCINSHGYVTYAPNGSVICN